MRRYRTEFFDEPKEESRIKLRILQKYLVPWSSKVGRFSSGKTIWVIDGFAGPGTYKDAANTPGSPKLILDRARKTIAEKRTYRIGCLFVEKEQAHYSLLKALCAEYTEVQHEVLHGDFWQVIPEVTKKTAGQPVFIVVDPFGVKGLDYQQLARLCNASPKCDLVVTFVSSAVPRLEAQYPAAIELAIGSKAAGDTSAAQTFARNMATAGGFEPGGRFPIKQSFNAAKAYELIVFSRSAHAYRLWNDFVTREWRELSRLKPKLGGKQPLIAGFAKAFEEAGVDEERKDAANEILAWTSAAKADRFPRREMLDEFAVRHFGDFHSSTLIQAIKLLEKEDRLSTSEQTRNESTIWRVISRQPL